MDERTGSPKSFFACFSYVITALKIRPYLRNTEQQIRKRRLFPSWKNNLSFRLLQLLRRPRDYTNYYDFIGKKIRIFIITKWTFWDFLLGKKHHWVLLQDLSVFQYKIGRWFWKSEVSMKLLDRIRNWRKQIVNIQKE